jgi:mannose-6-phosphate isomerase-like protein (cupin superfamily)
MSQTDPRALVLELRHTGERLTLRRTRAANGIEEMHLAGSLPPQREGPPLHIHTHEEEYGEVLSGTLSATVDGKQLVVHAGGSARFPQGCAHRWWNAGGQDVVFRGVVTPVVDLDRFLQAIFKVMNAGPVGRPSLFYMAHVLHRHRHSQKAIILPLALQPVLLPLIVLVGTVLGKYRGTAWPGCPSRCTGAPPASRPL